MLKYATRHMVRHIISCIVSIFFVLAVAIDAIHKPKVIPAQGLLLLFCVISCMYCFKKAIAYYKVKNGKLSQEEADSIGLF